MQREIAHLETAVEDAPRQIERVNELGLMLVAAGRASEALTLWDRVIRRAEAPTDGTLEYDDLEPYLLWAMNGRARALYRLGKAQDAVAQMEQARRRAEHGHTNVSQAINLAGYYVALNEPARALQTLGDVGVMNPFGRMQLESIRASAAAEARDAEILTSALAYLREHSNDAPTAYQKALIAAERLDDAALYLTDRLADPVLRLEALAEVQSYAEASALPVVLTWRSRWQVVLARQDVAATIRSVGRIDHYSLCSGPF